MNKPFTFIKTLTAASLMLAVSSVAANQQLWPQSENAYQKNKQQSPQWIESQRRSMQPNQAPSYNIVPQQVPQGYPQAYNQPYSQYSQPYNNQAYAPQYAPNNYYAPRPYGGKYPPQYRSNRNGFGNMPFFGGNNRNGGGWPNGDWGNWNMPNMDMSMPDMNMPNMSNMPFSNMPSPSFDMPSPSFTTPNMPMPFWN